MNPRRHDRQRGVAVITALLLTTLAVTIVASLFWQQQVQVRSIENQRLQLQKQWILRGALDWTRLILREDKRIDRQISQQQQTDHLGEPWAVPLAETRLDQYVEKDRAGDVPDAALSGGITDAQARFNLKNICESEANCPNVDEVKAFGKLLTNLQLNPALASATANLMMSALRKPQTPGAPQSPADSSSPQPMGIEHVDDLLAVPGFTPEALAKLRDYVIVLPKKTPINANTASAEVLSAKLDKLTLSEAMAVVSARKNKVFKSNEELKVVLGSVEPRDISYSSEYFLITGNVRLNRAGMEMLSLIYRSSEPNKNPVVLWIREY